MEIIFRFTQTIVALPLSVCLLLDKERLEGNLNFLKIIGYLWKSLEIFGNHWKPLESKNLSKHPGNHSDATLYGVPIVIWLKPKKTMLLYCQQ